MTLLRNAVCVYAFTKSYQSSSGLLIVGNISCELTGNSGSDAQLFIAKGKGHLYDFELFTGHKDLEEFEEAWASLEAAVKRSQG